MSEVDGIVIEVDDAADFKDSLVSFVVMVVSNRIPMFVYISPMGNGSVVFTLVLLSTWPRVVFTLGAVYSYWTFLWFGLTIFQTSSLWP